MGDENRPLGPPPPESENKKFIKLSVQNIVQGAIGLLIAGILAFMGTQIMSGLKKVEDHRERIIKLETWKDEALLDALNDLDDAFGEYKKESSTKLGNLSGEQKKILSEISKIQGILEEMRRNR